MEDIKQLLGDELYNQVLSKIGNSKLIVDDGKLIPYSRFQEVNEKKNYLQQQIESQKESYENQINSINKQLNEFSELPKITQEMKDKISTLTQSNDKLKNDYEIRLKEQKLDHEIDMKLIAMNARNVKAVKALLDFSKIKIDGENIIGFTDQVESIKKDNDYLFGEILKSGQTPKAGDISPTPKSQLEKDYNEAVKNFGMASPQAITIKQQLWQHK